jgi:hypothetical protein
MKPNEPSRTALMIARQRAAHQLLDHGAILDDRRERSPRPRFPRFFPYLNAELRGTVPAR